MAVAGQKFLTGVVNDAMQLAKRKAMSAPRGKKAVELRLVLSPEDVAAALKEVGGSCDGPRQGGISGCFACAGCTAALCQTHQRDCAGCTAALCQTHQRDGLESNARPARMQPLTTTASSLPSDCSMA